MNAYNEGNEAFYDNKKLDDNPYPTTDPDSDMWESGYIDADSYEFGENDGWDMCQTTFR